MGFIYENPTEYAKTCQCDKETAKKRCGIYLHLHGLMEKVKCPCCQAEYHQLTYDDEGGDYASKPFISCTKCWEGFDTEDARLKDWVNYHAEFDEVLSISLSGIEDYGIEDWHGFVNRSTEELETRYTIGTMEG